MIFTFISSGEEVQIIIYPNSVTVNAGNSVLFACAVYGNPAPGFVWMRPQEGGVTFVQSILKICNLNLSDGGPYICLATNLHGNDNATFDLTVSPVSGMCQTCFSL